MATENLINAIAQLVQGKQDLKEFADVFPTTLPGKLPPKHAIYHTIELVPGTEPPIRPIYKMSYTELDELKKQLTDLSKKGYIQPSVSPFGAPDTERYLDPLTDSKHGAKLFSTLLRSLIAHAGKEFLPNDGTIILEDIYHLPLPIFSYPSFIQVLSTFHLDWVCPPFKKLDISKIDIPFLYLSGARKCFSQIYELHCDNTASPHLYYHLTSMCSIKLFINENDDHNKKDGGLIIRKDLKSDNRGLAYLISLQKYLECVVYGSVYNVVNLELHKEISKALIKFYKIFYSYWRIIMFSTRNNWSFFEPDVLEILVNDNIEDLFQDMCMSTTFKGLEILRIGVLDLYGFWPNGKKKLSQLNETIAQYCYQNLHYLTTTSISDVKDVRQILVSCEQLEGLYLVSNEKEIDSEELFQFLITITQQNFQNYVYSTKGTYPKLPKKLNRQTINP
nr:3628_t:CDS:2 [Entrophospora candida]